MFTGTIASNIAYGNGTASREEIEAAALEANCDFVWGMPQGFDTPSKVFHEVDRYDSQILFSRQVESLWWPEAKIGDRQSTPKEAGHFGIG